MADVRQEYLNAAVRAATVWPIAEETKLGAGIPEVPALLLVPPGVCPPVPIVSHRASAATAKVVIPTTNWRRR
jgi:hypothetical protein